MYIAGKCELHFIVFPLRLLKYHFRRHLAIHFLVDFNTCWYLFFFCNLSFDEFFPQSCRCSLSIASTSFSSSLVRACFIPCKNKISHTNISQRTTMYIDRTWSSLSSGGLHRLFPFSPSSATLLKSFFLFQFSLFIRARVNYNGRCETCWISVAFLAVSVQ